MAFLMASFSACVKSALFPTFVFAGTTGVVLSASDVGLSLAVALPSSVDVFPASSVALALTKVLSFTFSAGIVTTPEAGSIFRPLSAGRVQLP